MRFLYEKGLLKGFNLIRSSRLKQKNRVENELNSILNSLILYHKILCVSENKYKRRANYEH